MIFNSCWKYYLFFPHLFHRSGSFWTVLWLSLKFLYAVSPSIASRSKSLMSYSCWPVAPFEVIRGPIVTLTWIGKIGGWKPALNSEFRMRLRHGDEVRRCRQVFDYHTNGLLKNSRWRAACSNLSSASISQQQMIVMFMYYHQLAILSPSSSLADGGGWTMPRVWRPCTSGFLLHVKYVTGISSYPGVS